MGGWDIAVPCNLKEVQVQVRIQHHYLLSPGKLQQPRAHLNPLSQPPPYRHRTRPRSAPWMRRNLTTTHSVQRSIPLPSPPRLRL